MRFHYVTVMQDVSMELVARTSLHAVGVRRSTPVRLAFGCTCRKATVIARLALAYKQRTIQSVILWPSPTDQRILIIVSIGLSTA